jgi:Protein of unknown function (DUF3617)
MMFVKNSIKGLICLSCLMFVGVASAQKMANLLVMKDIIPGQYLETPTIIPKGMEAHMIAENYCATKEHINEILNNSTQFGGNGKIDKNNEFNCPTTLVANTATEAMLKINCSAKSMNIKTETTFSIKRQSTSTWTFTTTGQTDKGVATTMQTTMKYLGACVK